MPENSWPQGWRFWARFYLADAEAAVSPQVGMSRSVAQTRISALTVALLLPHPLNLTSNCPNSSCFVARARHSPAEVLLSQGLEFCSGQIVPTCPEAAAPKLKEGLWNDLRCSESRCSSSSKDNSGFVTFPGCLLWEESDFLSCGVKQVGQFVPVSGCERAQSLHELWGSPNNKIPKYSFLFLVPEVSPDIW